MKDLCQEIKTRKLTVPDIMDEAPTLFVQYNKGLAALSNHARIPPKMREVKVSIYYGPTGTGKTFKAFMENKEVYKKNPNDKWWNGYNGQPVAIWDDFEGSREVPVTTLLTWADVYQCQAEVKGGYVWLSYNELIITTNVHPRHWYEWKNPHYKAFQRRVQEVVIFKEPTTGVDGQKEYDGGSHVEKNEFFENFEKFLFE